MPTPKKIETVKDLEGRLLSSRIVIATGYQGISVAQISQLRRKLRESGVEFKVVKNTLARLAAVEVDRPGVIQILQGPTAFVIGYSDPVEPAKVLTEHIRSNRLPMEIRGAVMDGRVLSSSDVATLTTLPSREVLIAQVLAGFQSPLVNLVGTLRSPMVGVVNALNGILSSLAWVVEARRRQLEEGNN
ncbi:MAG: ribosomal protein [Dehalococcoidia bacterium]|nr:ribosomal protein [Dehalococcoidia bacterium]